MWGMMLTPLVGAILCSTLVGLVIVLALCVAIFGWVSVNHGYAAVTEYQGEFYRTLGPGWYLLYWPLERLRHVSWSYSVESQGSPRAPRTVLEYYTGPYVFMGVRTYDFPAINVWSSDRQMVAVNGYVDYKITSAQTAVYASDNPLGGLELLISSSLRNAIAEMTYEEAVGAQIQLRKLLLTDCNHILEQRGIQLIDLRIQSILPSQEIIKSNEKAIIARRDAEAHKILESTKREAMVLSAKTEADIKAMQLAAELKRNEDSARSYAACLRTRAEAEADAEKAKAQGKRAYSEAVGPQFMAAEAYSRALRAIGKRAGNTLVLPYDAAQAMGGLNIAQATTTAAALSRGSHSG